MYDGRTYTEMKQWDPQLRKIYYQINPKNPNEMRTIRIQFDSFNGTKRPVYSNWHVATPTQEMEAASPMMLSQLNRVQQTNAWESLA